MKSIRNNPWVWIQRLYSAESIPVAVVIFVAILMFIQTGNSIAISSLLCGLLFLPWILMPFFRIKVRRSERLNFNIHLAEFLIFILFCTLAYILNFNNPDKTLVFISLMLMSAITAWHKLLAQMYYERKLYSQEQAYFSNLRTYVVQTTIILTYGVTIILVGLLQIFFGNISKGWSMGCYLMGGCFFILSIINLFVKPSPDISQPKTDKNVIETMKVQVKIIDRILEKKNWLFNLFTLFLLLLPQGLMFFTRVIYLYTPEHANGLGCSIQEIGFAQGTIGVIAFTIGLFYGKKVRLTYGWDKTFLLMAIVLGLSPSVYCYMTFFPPQTMFELCIATFISQISFGFGLNVCNRFIEYFSGNRYKNTYDYLTIPVVALVIIIPIMISGYLLEMLDFKEFFIINALAAIPAIIMAVICKSTKKLLEKDEKQ